MTPELETELRTEIARLREVNAELSATKGVQILRIEVRPAPAPAGASAGVNIMATCSLGDEFTTMALRMIAMSAAQLGGIVAAAGATPPAPEAAS